MNGWVAGKEVSKRIWVFPMEIDEWTLGQPRPSARPAGHHELLVGEEARQVGRRRRQLAYRRRQKAATPLQGVLDAVHRGVPDPELARSSPTAKE